jgi:putative lipoic acid-binding regulatory protein
MKPIRPEDSLITYPCDFPIKVMGRAHDDFARAMAEVARGFDPASIPTPSKSAPAPAAITWA